MQRLRMPGRRGDTSADHLPDEEVVLSHETRIVQAAFEVGEALADEGSLDRLRGLAGQAEPVELVDVGAAASANAYDLVGQRRRRQIDDAFPTPTNQLE